MRALLLALAFTATVVTNVSLSHSANDPGEQDAITAPLPGLPPLSVAPFGNATNPLKHYSGYLQVSDTHFLHYWFIRALGVAESENTPVVFWFNGGPGCSSLFGLLAENGPYLLADDGKTLKWNKHGWAKFAHIVYIESPAGVGFSYSTDGNTDTGDEQTAAENYAAVKRFLFDKFPSLSKNPVFITGESYAGVYIPMLAVKIIDADVITVGNHTDGAINLQGVAIGNGCVHEDYEAVGLVKYGVGHGLIRETDYNAMLETCCAESGLVKCDIVGNDKQECQDMFDELSSELDSLSLFVYNILRTCDTDPSTPKNRLMMTMSGRKRTQQRGRGNVFNRPTSFLVEDLTCQPFDMHTSDYLNKPDVLSALKIAHPPSGGWQGCAHALHYNETVADVTSQMKHIVDSGVRALLYYGDLDVACNFIGAEEFTASLGYEAHGERGPWLHAGQIAGFKQAYANDTLTFVTVLGAGHMSPADKPIQVAYAIEKFLNGEPL